MCEDAWLTASAMLAETERLKFLVAFRPGLVPPTLAAQQAATFQRFSDGRLLLNVVSGGDESEQRRFGDWLSHDERYSRTGEFLHIVKSIWETESFDFSGVYFTIRDGPGVRAAEPVATVLLRWFVRCRAPIAAEHVDVYYSWGEPPQAGRGEDQSGPRPGRPAGPDIEIRNSAAHHQPGHLGGGVGGGRGAGQGAHGGTDHEATRLHSRSDSEGQRRMTALHGGQIDKLEIYPNLWAGVGLVRGGAGTALVGSHEEVANLIYEYHSLGFDEFILSVSALEEAYWFAEGVFPLLKAKGVIAS